MRDRGKKPLENFTDFSYSAPDLICKKHSNLPPIGICPICLREKLNNLFCSVCGDQKLPFCSCSDSKRNSNSSDVGSVGRISFLIENEKQKPISKNPQNEIKSGYFLETRRPNSETHQNEIKSDPDHEQGVKKSGLWRIVRMFRKKREKGSERENEMWVFDQLGVSRSRSLCSFQESSSDYAFSSAKISDFNSSSERVSNFSETEPRKSGFRNRVLRESDFGNMDESGFIDLKLDLETGDIKSDFGNMRRGGSCRITERDKTGDLKREKKGKRVLKWILKHNYNWRSRSLKDDGSVLRA